MEGMWGSKGHTEKGTRDESKRVKKKTRQQPVPRKENKKDRKKKTRRPEAGEDPDDLRVHKNGHGRRLLKGKTRRSA